MPNHGLILRQIADFVQNAEKSLEKVAGFARNSLEKVVPDRKPPLPELTEEKHIVKNHTFARAPFPW